MHGAVILGLLRRSWPAIAVLLVCLAWGLLGYKVGTALSEVRLAAVLKAQAEARNARVIEALKTERAAADAAVALAQTRAEVADAVARRYRYEIDALTDGRNCLGGDARRLLHQSPAFAVPNRAGRAGGTAAAAAADPRDRYSTDRDLALWAADVAVLYETCRSRIDAVMEWSRAASDEAL